MRLLKVVQQESPVTLAREVLWRTTRRWRQSQLPEKLGQDSCPVTYRSIGYYQPRLLEYDAAERDTILRYAEAICSGQFPWFAYGPVRMGFPPAWNLDFVSGNTWPEVLANAVRVAPGEGTDVKVPWELSRLQFLPVLGKAWRLSGEKRYCEAGRELLSDWIEKNPVGVGVNWTVAMEAALRAISICLFLELLSPGPAIEQPWITDVSKSLWQHLLFIEAHNEFSHLVQSNHYLSNIVGLFCLAAFLQGPKMDTRRQRYRSLIEREIFRQVYADGGDYEASSGYHVLCLEMFTTAFLLMRSLGIAPRAMFTLRLQEMYCFLTALTDVGGRVPLLGDCDDGRVELFTDDLGQMLAAKPKNRYSLTVCSLLRTGEFVLGKNYQGRGRAAPRHRSVSKLREGRKTSVYQPRYRIFKNSGLAVATNKDIEVVFAAMPNGIGGKGSHTHNDKLSVIVKIAEEELFSDSGTGCYTRDATLRNQLRSTAAHNTIEIDGEEQNRFSASRSDLFRLRDDARVSPIETEESGEEVVLRSSHDGYRRLGITHARTIRLTTQPSLIVEDVLGNYGSHSFRMFFHLGRPKKVTIEQTYGREISAHIAHAGRLVRLTCHSEVELQLSCIPSKISTSYGHTHQSTTFVVSGRFHSSLELTSRIDLQV